MSITLKRGEFFGRSIATGEWGGLALSETSYARGAFLPRHSHEEAYLTFVLDGAYRERVQSETRTCAARSLVVHAPGEAHENDFTERRARCLNLTLGTAFASRLGDAVHVLARGGVVADGNVAGIGHRVAAELRRTDAAAPLIVEGLVLELFGLLSRREDEPRRVPAWLGEARAIVERDFQRKLVLAELASEVGVHPVSLARAFRRHFGMTVGDAVRQLRIAYARERIAAGVALHIVAAEAGFADQSHFTRAFTRSVGVAPASYRRTVQRVPRR
ncbi:MAG TPA: AraC family transcriptional regulator [Thermoanaerobaculia bacterium]|nr:AraC family transcriptional regulator [Thermoanaerobaculia bacterium]